MNVGDEIVIFQDGSVVGIRRAARVLKTKMVDDKGHEWSLRSKRPWGSDSVWGRTSFYPRSEVNEDRIHRDLLAIRHRRLVDNLRTFEWKKLDVPALEDITRLAKQKLDEATG